MEYRGEVVTWESFKARFFEWYFLDTAIYVKEIESMQLK